MQKRNKTRKRKRNQDSKFQCKCEDKYCGIVSRFLQHAQPSQCGTKTRRLCGYNTIHYPALLLTDKSKLKCPRVFEKLTCHEAIQVSITLCEIY